MPAEHLHLGEQPTKPERDCFDRKRIVHDRKCPRERLTSRTNARTCRSARGCLSAAAWCTLSKVALSAPRTKPSWAAFGAWAAIGAGYSLGFLSILTIGAGVLALTAVTTIALTRWSSGMSGAFGLVSGLAPPVFYIAYLNRDGPGTICTSGARSESCVDEWSPWPFIAAGLVLLAAGSVAFATVRRRQLAR
jgi:hypothetical protein